MFDKIKLYIKTHIDPHLEKPLYAESKPHILLGLSGGPDSMFLLYFLRELLDANLIDLTALHLNHGWRPSADAEEAFCKRTCKQLGVRCLTGHVKNLVLDRKANGSKEELGRLYRRHFFEKIKSELGADHVALAHHEQDQQETFFIRLIRGCSLSGLIAMKPVQSFYIRPLLRTSKVDILAYLDGLRESGDGSANYVIDESNVSEDFLRNRIRKHVLPALLHVDARFSQKFQSSLDALGQENNLLEKVTQEAFDRIFSDDGNAYKADKAAFAELDPSLQKRVVITWLCAEGVSFRPSVGFLEEIISFIVSERGGTHRVHHDWFIKKQKKLFWIEQTDKP